MSDIERLEQEDLFKELKYNEQGLIPAIIQDWQDGAVLMLGYMNEKSLETTLQSGKITFWSRSRKKYWTKGETSGNFLLLKEIFTDCDKDTILIKAEAKGPTCHTGKRSCFSWKVTS
ncbi:phosphoribosyl-AMP cyclohydrolase [candidate division KSB1 bacterium]|nr:phosphoribosyl-AMP cyclohydrolase [candidate division KSB1 bacterium]